MLKPISIGWHWLERTLNGIIEEVNAQKPLPSATIAVEQSPNGTLLKVVGIPQNQPPGTGAGKTKPIIWHNVAWQKVTLIDPANNCAPTTLSILVQQPGSSITIQ
jgi:hypothetical protein